MKANTRPKFKFIWGESLRCPLGDKPSLRKPFDISIIYNCQSCQYELDIETIYNFDNKQEEAEYLSMLLIKFREYMKSNNLTVNEPYELWCAEVGTPLVAPSIPKLYTNFKIFVEGYKALYR